MLCAFQFYPLFTSSEQHIFHVSSKMKKKKNTCIVEPSKTQDSMANVSSATHGKEKKVSKEWQFAQFFLGAYFQQL